MKLHHENDDAASRAAGRPHANPKSFRAQIIAMLGDGRPRDAQTILDEGLARGLFSPATTKGSVYENILLYIHQEAAGGHKAAIVEDPITRKFRINRPVDDWPDATLPPHPRYISADALQTMSEKLRTTGDGDDSTAFELAVCEAFALLGFVTQHVGGMYAPDGILDAPLGPLAYRAVLECKSAPNVKFVSQPRAEEAAKFRDASKADFAVLVGPDFHAGESFSQEIQTHAISVWTIEDVITALRIDVDTYECRELFTPGFVYDRLADLEWSRTHGEEKRAHVVRDILRREGYAAQSTLAGHVAPADAPVLTLDAAMLLVETALRRAGADACATREEVQDAMDDLVRSRQALRITDRNGIIIRRTGDEPKGR